MNVKELMELLELVEGAMDLENIPLCLNDSRDGTKSFPEASAHFAKDDADYTILVIGYKR